MDLNEKRLVKRNLNLLHFNGKCFQALKQIAITYNFCTSSTNPCYTFRSRKVTLTNFCLGKHLMNNNDLLKDQRGSPAYISPDVLSGKPYAGKPSDMWALGVVLFTMLYGQFPFYDNAPYELFQSEYKFIPHKITF